MSRVPEDAPSVTAHPAESGAPVPITIFTGTKAQFIKMAPLAMEFERRGWSYNLVDTAQHAQLVSHIIEQFGLRQPDHSLAPSQRGVETLAGGLRWLLGVSSHLLRSSASLRGELFGGQTGICFVHGDTVSTLVSALVAMRAGQRVAHVEAGLRSHRLLHPFPEELIRVIVMRLADLLFAPSPAAYRNLEQMGLADRAELLPGNTNMDTLAFTLAQPCEEVPDLPPEYNLVTIHRLETLYSRKRIERIVAFVLDANEAAPVVFVQHPPTARRLEEYGLTNRLREAGVYFLPLVDHRRFVGLLQHARLVMTDGGSVQEEAYYLGTPCLILREATEREEGLGENAVLSKLDPAVVREVVANPGSYRRASHMVDFKSPSAAIADWLAGASG